MTRDVIGVPPDAELEEVLRALADDRISAVPVVSAELRPLGLVTRAKLATVEPNGQTAIDVMDEIPAEIPPDTTLGAAARALLHAGARQLLVVECERLVGIVTTMDLIRGFARTARLTGAGER